VRHRRAVKSYAKPVEVGQPMVGGTVGRIVVSRHPRYAVGDIVLGYGGWQEYAVSNGAGLRKLDPAAAPISTALVVLGMPGMTAYVGPLEIGQPKPGETVVVAAASGAVGSMVGQIAKIKDCRAVGIAGGAEKCRYVTGTFSFDACVDHRASVGIAVYFENVGGAVQQQQRQLREKEHRPAAAGRMKENGPPLVWRPKFRGGLLERRPRCSSKLHATTTFKWRD
jgi:NADPH-dependent curcumin reductase CurA